MSLDAGPPTDLAEILAPSTGLMAKLMQQHAQLQETHAALARRVGWRHTKTRFLQRAKVIHASSRPLGQKCLLMLGLLARFQRSLAYLMYRAGAKYLLGGATWLEAVEGGEPRPGGGRACCPPGRLGPG